MGDKYHCECRHCGKRRSITTGYRAAGGKVKDLFAENDCACPKPLSILTPKACDECGETGKHWLGCPVIGLPEIPN